MFSVSGLDDVGDRGGVAVQSLQQRRSLVVVVAEERIHCPHFDRSVERPGDNDSEGTLAFSAVVVVVVVLSNEEETRHLRSVEVVQVLRQRGRSEVGEVVRLDVDVRR